MSQSYLNEFLDDVQFRNEDRKNLCLLQFTRPDLKNERFASDSERHWRALADAYRAADHTDPVNRVLLDVANAVMFQKRMYCNLSRESLQALTRGSQNWPTNQGFRPTLYAKILSALQERGYVRLVAKGVGHAAACYEIVKAPLLEHLKENGIDSVAGAKQRRECLLFARRGSPRIQGTDQGNTSEERIEGTQDNRIIGTKDVRNLGPYSTPKSDSSHAPSGTQAYISCVIRECNRLREVAIASRDEEEARFARLADKSQFIRAAIMLSSQGVLPDDCGELSSSDEIKKSVEAIYDDYERRSHVLTKTVLASHSDNGMIDGSGRR